MDDSFQNMINTYQKLCGSVLPQYNPIEPVMKQYESILSSATLGYQKELTTIMDQLKPYASAGVLSSVMQMQSVLHSAFPDEGASISFIKDTCGQIDNALKGVVKPAVLSQVLQNTISQISREHPAFRSVKITDEYVDIPDYVMPEISKTIDTSTLDEVPNSKPGENSHRYELIQFWISLLIPLVFQIASMCQTAYYHKIDLLQEQQSKIEEEDYQNQLLQIEQGRLQELEELTESVNFLLDFLQNNPESTGCLLESPDSPDRTDTVQESALEIQISDSEISADPESFDASLQTD